MRDPTYTKCGWKRHKQALNCVFMNVSNTTLFFPLGESLIYTVNIKAGPKQEPRHNPPASSKRCIFFLSHTCTQMSCIILSTWSGFKRTSIPIYTSMREFPQRGNAASTVLLHVSPFCIWKVEDSSEGIAQGLGSWSGWWPCDKVWEVEIMLYVEILQTEAVLGPYPCSFPRPWPDQRPAAERESVTKWS